MSRHSLLMLAVAISGGCAPPPPGAGMPAGAPQRDVEAQEDAIREEQMVPPGYGTLRQDDATMSIRSGAVQVKVTPLDEATIRLLAPDTYTRLHAIAGSRREEAARDMTRNPELFLVSFISYQQNMTFQPEDVQIMHQARLLRPAVILPVTTGWGQQMLRQQETQTAVYAFEGPIEYDQPITLRYGMQQSDEWMNIISALESERARVWTRVR